MHGFSNVQQHVSMSGLCNRSIAGHATCNWLITWLPKVMTFVSLNPWEINYLLWEKLLIHQFSSKRLHYVIWSELISSKSYSGTVFMEDWNNKGMSKSVNYIIIGDL